ncbi:MAG TPA: tetratricopeptide repeat protein [Isosphaeraceae bacterium]|jgi:tetratricopeptide (TPR) repeat protein|nr:tetratricopeptide repeat protein [Isosphaeraceae bacterium]
MEPVRKPGRRVLTVAAAIVAILACVGAALAWPRLTQSSLQRGRAAYARGDWAAAHELAKRSLATQPDDRVSLRLNAEAAARLGRDDEAEASYLRLDAEDLAPDDLVLLGEILSRQGKPALAATAFATALAMQPRHPDALRAQAQLFAQAGRDAQWSRFAEHLGAVRRTLPRTELLLGLLRHKRDQPDVAADIMDRLNALDRTELARVRMPSHAQKLLARVLLESGRPTVARAELVRLLTEAPNDVEGIWLLSRAFLQEGLIEQARKAAEAAEDFRAARPAVPEPAPLVGSARCLTCHRAIAQSVSRSRHAETLRLPADLNEVPLPQDPIADPHEPTAKTTIRRDRERIDVEASADGKTAHALVRFLLGSGHRGTTMVVRDDDGTDRKLRLSYYAVPAAWDDTDRFPDPPRDVHERLGMPLSDEGIKECLHCHATSGQAVRDKRGPEAADHGVGCERCHGPGSNHLKAVVVDFADLAIVQPKLTSAAERVAMCAQCHRSDGTIAPSDPAFVRFQTPVFQQSRCYTESGGQLDCTTCHNPHRNAETSASFYEAKCLTCHGPEAKTLEGLSPAAACPVNPQRDCLGCHMPTIKDVAMHSSFTDHRIRVRHEGAPQK